MIAKSAIGILSNISLEESVEASNMCSFLNKKLKEDNYDSLISKKPFVMVHHTITTVGLIGGGANPIPGDISLVHNYVLFIDELSELSKKNIGQP